MALIPSIFRWTEHRLIVEGLNDGDNFGSGPPGVLSGEAFFNTAPGGTTIGTMFKYYAATILPKYREGMNPPAGRVMQCGPTATSPILLLYRPYLSTATTSFLTRDSNGASGLPATVGTLSPNLLVTNGGPGYGRSTSIMAWVRKLAGGDVINQRFTFGFVDSSVISGTFNSQARVGLIGNNTGGFMFGSVNCPDGPNTHLEVFGDVNANSVQPVDINTPTTNWFHVRIKLIPQQFGVSSGPKIECYLNGTLAATFTDPIQNFPRGSLNTNHNYERMEAGIVYQAATDGVTVLPPVLFSDVRVWVENPE